MATKSKQHTGIGAKQAPSNAKTALTPKQQHEVRFLNRYLPFLRRTAARGGLLEDFHEVGVVRRTLKWFRQLEHWRNFAGAPPDEDFTALIEALEEAEWEAKQAKAAVHEEVFALVKAALEQAERKLKRSDVFAPVKAALSKVALKQVLEPPLPQEPRAAAIAVPPPKAKS